MALVPKSTPKQTLADTLKILDKYNWKPNEKVKLLGIRGYYKDTMGVAGVNDRGMYDDAFFLISPSLFMAVNGNTDASRVRKGKGFGAGKGMAMLKPGQYRAHIIGTHKKIYPALVQRAGKVTVIRDGTPNYEETGMFGINIHPGGKNGTSSLGCQTVPTPQWKNFIATVQAQLKMYNQTVLPYVLEEV